MDVAQPPLFTHSRRDLVGDGGVALGPVGDKAGLPDHGGLLHGGGQEVLTLPESGVRCVVGDVVAVDRGLDRVPRRADDVAEVVEDERGVGDVKVGVISTVDHA